MQHQYKSEDIKGSGVALALVGGLLVLILGFVQAAHAQMSISSETEISVSAGESGKYGENGDDGTPSLPLRPETIEEQRALFEEKRAKMVERQIEMRAELGEKFKGGHASSTEARQEWLEERRAEMEERRDAVIEHLEGRFKAFVERMVRRMEAATERLDGIADRIEARIAKFEERGIELSAATELLDEARVEIDAAASAVAGLPEVAESVLSSDVPREHFGDMRTAFGEAKEALKAAHAALVASIREIKASVEAEVEAETDVDIEASTSTDSE